MKTQVRKNVFETNSSSMDRYDDYDDGYFYDNNNSLSQRARKIEDFAVVQQKIAQPAYSPNVARISWEAPESIAQKDSYKKYLQLAGKNIKLNLNGIKISQILLNKFGSFSVDNSQIQGGYPQSFTLFHKIYVGGEGGMLYCVYM